MPYYGYIMLFLLWYCFQARRNGRFGFLFDIDGVIVRGEHLLPAAKEAFDLLTDRHGHFQVPALFVTNAGNTLRQRKAEQLSEWLKVKVILLIFM
jgi:ribonucleotide monophosphatase NagD (HAD superfamily)